MFRSFHRIRKGPMHLFGKISLDNLQLKVLLVFLVVALMPLGIVATFSIKTAEELIFNMASNQLVNVANDKVSLLDRWMAERKSDLKVVAGSSILKSMDPEEIASYLSMVFKVSLGKTGETYLVDRNGTFLAAPCQHVIITQYQ